MSINKKYALFTLGTLGLGALGYIVGNYTGNIFKDNFSQPVKATVNIEPLNQHVNNNQNNSTTKDTNRHFNNAINKKHTKRIPSKTDKSAKLYQTGRVTKQIYDANTLKRANQFYKNHKNLSFKQCLDLVQHQK